MNFNIEGVLDTMIVSSYPVPTTLEYEIDLSFWDTFYLKYSGSSRCEYMDDTGGTFSVSVCHLDGTVCKCNTINSCVVTHVDIPNLTRLLYNYIYDSKDTVVARNSSIDSILHDNYGILKYYLFDRILRINGVYLQDCWTCSWRTGYYGQELHKCSFDKRKSLEIKKTLQDIDSISSMKDRILFILNLEYGHIIKEITEMDFEVIDVDYQSVIPTQISHCSLIKIDNEIHYNDHNYNSIVAVCIKEGDYYRIIDGYHRFLTTKKTTIKIISFYEPR